MPAPLSNSEFLTQLSNLFASRQAKGSVFITQKRLTYQAPTAEGDAEMAEAEGSGAGHAEGEADEDEREWPCLIRATDGQSKSTTKIKISTIVQPQDYTTFSTAYGNLLKASMSSLRKKRKAKGAAKSKAKAKDAAGKATQHTLEAKDEGC
ncbi:signal recognition particle, SRP14 subunit [Pseudohyphozyma bogoriensis]|nr:signal recognition particle, SRP14 subunit [Pseudohyphozyma bogoriensis]